MVCFRDCKIVLIYVDVLVNIPSCKPCDLQYPNLERALCSFCDCFQSSDVEHHYNDHRKKVRLLPGAALLDIKSRLTLLPSYKKDHVFLRGRGEDSATSDDSTTAHVRTAQTPANTVRGARYAGGPATTPTLRPTTEGNQIVQAMLSVERRYDAKGNSRLQGCRGVLDPAGVLPPGVAVSVPAFLFFFFFL